MGNVYVKKILATVVILLFIGVTITPSINASAVKASDGNDLIEVTSQACGFQGFANTTVKLTRQQYQNLEKYLCNFRARLNQTMTSEEAAPLFNEALQTLASYRLLPPEWRMKDTQVSMLRLVAPRASPWGTENASRNLVCLVAGQINYTVSIYPFWNVLRYLGVLLGVACFIPDILLHWYLMHRDHLLFPRFIQNLGLACELLMIIPEMFQNVVQVGMILSDRGPQALRNIVGVGSWELGGQFEPSDGWLTSFGLLGKKEWNGTLYGTLPLPPIGTAAGIIDFEYAFFPGIMGFSGVKLSTSEEPGLKFFLGAAVAVGLGPEPPQQSGYVLRSTHV